MTNSKKGRQFVALLALLFFSQSSFSAMLWCSGKIEDIFVYDAGHVTIYSEWRQGLTTVCGLEAVWQGIPVETCKGWLALLESAKAQGATVTLHYLDAGDTCSTLPLVHSTRVPVYVRSHSLLP